ncbi:GAF and ANTAR domain-containing protein [Kribbella shirazensis]|uniref:GAF domain-containing protein n=1 Tax=Kribbella shirazensis TaxID=1105143 RepID=A0A7X5VEI3_9ACTN|nr:GAF and ANTAR domain-containing protein [Kribbella shirazensis]NIK59062.1 GAF domain-containing protein [Kribbella shirazensis]
MPETLGTTRAEVFAELALELHAAPNLDETVETVVRSAVPMVGCDYAGVLLAQPDGALVIGAVTDARVERMYRWQIENGAGPALDGLAGGHTVYVADVALATDWPQWQAEAVACEVGSVLHIPMLAGENSVGVLSLYGAKPHAFSDVDAEPIGRIIARHATVAISSSRKVEDLARAVDARKLVGLAMGILMERYDLDGDQAFEVLRRYSQHTNTKLHTVAQQLVDTRRLPS